MPRAPFETSDTGTQATPSDVAATVAAIKNNKPLPQTTSVPIPAPTQTQAEIDAAAKQHQADMDAAKAAAVKAAIAAGTTGSGPNGTFVVGDPGYKPNDPAHNANTTPPIVTGGTTPAVVTTPAVGTIPGTLNTDYVAAITALLHSYGIGDLAQSVVSSVQKGYTPDTINLIMQDPTSNDPLALAYQKRFSANQALFKAGKTVLSPSQYLNAEQTYAQIFQAHGLSQYATQDKFATLIANSVSPTEANDRITLGVDRIQNTDQSTKDALAQFYPSLNQKDLLGAVLNPSEGLPSLQRKVQIAEIGGAALAQGLDASQTADNNSIGASALADSGVTKQQAQTGYGNIGVYLPTAQKLSDVYSTQTTGYDQSTAEQDVFQNLASAQRARQGLTNLEVGSFTGSSGTLGPSYGTPRSSFNNLTPGQI